MISRGSSLRDCEGGGRALRWPCFFYGGWGWGKKGRTVTVETGWAGPSGDFSTVLGEAGETCKWAESGFSLCRPDGRGMRGLTDGIVLWERSARPSARGLQGLHGKGRGRIYSHRARKEGEGENELSAPEVLVVERTPPKERPARTHTYSFSPPHSLLTPTPTLARSATKSSQRPRLSS